MITGHVIHHRQGRCLPSLFRRCFGFREWRTFQRINHIEPSLAPNRKARLSSNKASAAFPAFVDPAVSEGTFPSEARFSSGQEPYASRTLVKKIDLLPYGCLSYPQTWGLQQVLLHRRLKQRRLRTQKQQLQAHENHQNLPGIDTNADCKDDCVLLLEHKPVYTMGRGADEKHLTFVQESILEGAADSSYSSSEVSKKLSRKVRGPGTARLSLDKTMEDGIRDLTGDDHGDGNNGQSMLTRVEKLTESISPVVAPNGVPVYRVDRGGEVTFHGPSQLVVYPMLDLKYGSPSYKDDLHWYLRRIEEVVLLTLKHYGIEACRDETNTGVWVGPDKIAAVGISSSRWITTHGFALNVDPDLSCFDASLILPCGIEGRGVTSMAEILRRRKNDSEAQHQQAQRLPSLAEVGVVATKMLEDVFGVTIQ